MKDHEIHALCVRHGRRARFPRDALLAAFEGHVRVDGGTHIGLEAVAGGRIEIFLSEEEAIEEFTLTGDLDLPELHSGLLALMRVFDIVLYRPGDGPLLIGRAEAARHVPPDMPEKAGKPVLVAHPWEIRAAFAAR